MSLHFSIPQGSLGASMLLNAVSARYTILILDIQPWLLSHFVLTKKNLPTIEEGFLDLKKFYRTFTQQFFFADTTTFFDENAAVFFYDPQIDQRSCWIFCKCRLFAISCMF